MSSKRVHKFLLAFLFVVLVSALAACAPGGGATATPTYDPDYPQGVPNNNLPVDELGPELDVPELGPQPPCPNNSTNCVTSLVNRSMTASHTLMT